MSAKLSLPCVFASSAIAATCCVCLIAILKSVLGVQCLATCVGNPGPTAIACLFFASLFLVTSAVHAIKMRVWCKAAAICSKWQPVFFVFVSVKKITIRAIVTYSLSQASSMTSSRSDPCSQFQVHIDAIANFWNCAVLLMAVSTMCCDIEAERSPAMRRCMYALLAAILLVDLTASVVWGNPLVSNVEFSIRVANVRLDNVITSCIASQAVIALHFVYVSCRSRRGRGWAYASLRFELDEFGQLLRHTHVRRPQKQQAHSLMTAMLVSEDMPTQFQTSRAAGSSTISRLYQRLLQFQKRQVARCRVFVIPCVEVHAGDFSLARPLLDLKCLRPLQRFADAHHRLYWGFFIGFLSLPGVLCSLFLKNGPEKGVSTLVLGLLQCIMCAGFMSSRRWSLDRVAVKHVASSFRFAIFFAAITIDIALSIRAVYRHTMHPTQSASIAILCVLFCMCVLQDCSPHLPSYIQILISVSTLFCAARKIVAQHLCRVAGAS